MSVLVERRWSLLIKILSIKVTKVIVFSIEKLPKPDEGLQNKQEK